MFDCLFPEFLIETKKHLFDTCGFVLTKAVPEQESSEYSACRIQLNDFNVVFRNAKITPTKSGQFVTLWKRGDCGRIQPYDVSDDFDLVIVNAKTDTHFGQFIFPKAVLLEQGVLTSNFKEGKRAIRIYPPWDITVSKQAQKTQQWQLEYFLNIPFDGALDVSRARFLYGLNE